MHVNDANPRAGWIIATAVLIALAGAGVWSATSLADARQAAADAAADTAACRQLAVQITAARHAPAATGSADEDVGPRLERAVAAAEIDEGSLTRVAPQPPRPLGQTGTARRTTQVVLERVSLKQTLSLVAALVGDGRRGLTLDTFELTVPPADAGGANPQATVGDDDWNVELAVSQVVKSTPKP